MANKREYEPIPENERVSYPSKRAAWQAIQADEQHADRGTATRVVEVLQDAIVDAVQAARDATRRK
jgi:hypothetical protein